MKACSSISRTRHADRREADKVVTRWFQWARPAYHALKDVLWKKSKTDWKTPLRDLRVAVSSETGHGDYGPYHRRMGHREWFQCACGSDITVAHPYRCVMMRDWTRVNLRQGRSIRKIQYLRTYWN